MNVTTKIAAAAIAGAMTMVTLPAIAQDAGDTTTEQTEERTTREEHRAEFEAALAEELGIPVEDLQAAIETVRAEFEAQRLADLRVRLDEKVAAGELTQEEADEIYARAEAGDFPHRRGHRGHRGPRDGDGDGPRGPGASEDAPAADAALDA